MSRNINSFLSAIILFLSVAVGACSSDSDNPVDTNTEFDYTQIITDFADKVVVGTYKDLRDHAEALNQAVVTFKTTSTQADINASAEAWRTTREPWESSEAFLFGPAAYKNLDPLLDSWPLDQAQLDQVLKGDQELTADFVRDGLGAVLRGFHTIEYLLFRDGEHRQASDVTQREKEYLAAVSEVMRDDCITLWASWAGVENGSEEAGILESLEIEIGTPYADEFKNAGQAGSRYLTQTDAIDEMIQGMIGIADEVGNAKIAGPVGSGNALDVESWFSWNSLTDFTNNVKSIQNSYLNGYNGSTPGASLSDFVQEKDPAIDAEVKLKITAAIDAIQAIPEPFRNNLGNTGKTSAAIQAMNELRETIEEEVRPMLFE